MGKGRIIFIFLVAVIAIILISFSQSNSGFEKVGRYNEYVIYYDAELDQGLEYEGYILKQGFYKITFLEAIETNEINQEYQEEIKLIIKEYEDLIN